MLVTAMVVTVMFQLLLCVEGLDAGSQIAMIVISHVGVTSIMAGIAGIVICQHVVVGCVKTVHFVCVVVAVSHAVGGAIRQHVYLVMAAQNVCVVIVIWYVVYGAIQIRVAV